MKKIKAYRECGIRWDYAYKATCPTCNKVRYMHSKSKIHRLCKSCAGKISHSNMSKETRIKMSKAKLGSIPWNVGIPMQESSKVKMIKSKIGQPTWNKDVPMLLGQKIKLSCANRGLEIKDFDDFSTPLNKRERARFDDSKLRETCFTNASHTCDLYGAKGEELNVHHLDAWHDNEDKRFDQSNLVCLSKAAHKTFHNIYGRKNNTKEQYEELKLEIEDYKKTKQDLYLIAGCPASGKSWVCEQLVDKFNYVSYDKVSKNYHVYELLKNNSKPLLYDPTIKISTFTKRYGHLFNIRLIVIVESKETIENRMLARGGKLSETIVRRIKRMSNLSKECEFSGTSSEVSDYLNKKAHF